MTNETVLSLLDHLCNDARNAMHAVSGLMEFQPDPAARPAWQTCLDASRSSTDRLLRTMDDMRELVGGQTPAVGPVEEIDWPMCVGETVDLLNLAAKDRCSPLLVECLNGSLRIRQDRQALEQVLARILKVASKLARNGPVRVVVSAAPEGRARLDIVPPGRDVARQLTDWLNADPDHLNLDEVDVGALLSLLVAGRRLRALGGVAEYACEPGATTGLAIYLPRETAAVWDQSSSSPTRTNPLQVLVAEDCDESYVLTELHLRKESVERARNGLEAIEKVKQRRFDVVFMDIHMPGMDGYQCIRAIRDWETQSRHARTVIIVMSSDDVGTQTRCAAESGCSGFLRKPVRQSDLEDLMEPLRAARNFSA